MNQEIKFRAWDGGEIYYNRYVEDSKQMIKDVLNHSCLQNIFYRQDLFDLEQFTGLKDKNGIDIYEKDIVSKGIHKYLVIKSEGRFGIFMEHYGFKCLNEFKHIEVIGNIHENEELLK